MATVADTPDKRIDQREGALLALANLFETKQGWRSGLPVQSVLDRDTEYKAFAAKFPGIKRDAVKRQHKKWLDFGRDALVNNASIDAETIATLVDSKLPDASIHTVITDALSDFAESDLVTSLGGLTDLVEFVKSLSDLWTKRVKALKEALASDKDTRKELLASTGVSEMVEGFKKDVIGSLPKKHVKGKITNSAQANVVQSTQLSQVEVA